MSVRLDRVRVGDLVAWTPSGAGGERYGEVTEVDAPNKTVRVRVIGRRAGEQPAVRLERSIVVAHWRRARH